MNTKEDLQNQSNDYHYLKKQIEDSSEASNSINSNDKSEVPTISRDAEGPLGSSFDNYQPLLVFPFNMDLNLIGEQQ